MSEDMKPTVEGTIFDNIKKYKGADFWASFLTCRMVEGKLNGKKMKS